MIETVREAVDYLKTELASRRFVCRNWRTFGSLDENFVSVEFTFLCPCGNDVRETVNFFLLDGSPLELDYRVKHVLRSVVTELESHLVGEKV